MATVNRETLIPLGLVVVVLSVVWSASLWLAGIVFEMRMEPRLLGLEQSVNGIAESVGEALPKTSFELWIWRSRQAGAQNLADPPTR